MKITAKYPGKCRNCGKYFEAGEAVFWSKGLGCAHITCENLVAAREAQEDPGNRAERELAEAEYREAYGEAESMASAAIAENREADTGDEPDGKPSFSRIYNGVDAEALAADLAEADRLTEEADVIHGIVCGLCGGNKPCGCDEPERGDAFLDLVEHFENEGEIVDEIPAGAHPATDEFFMGLSGLYYKGKSIWRLAPKAEYSMLLQKVLG